MNNTNMVDADHMKGLSLMATTDALLNEKGRNLVIADAAIEDVERLLAQLAPDTDLVRVDSCSDTAGILEHALESGYESLHFLGHGQPGAISLGGKTLEASDFTAHSHNDAVGTPSLHFWSCLTGAGAAGRSFVDRISQAFGSAVTAFSGLVGAKGLGGSWTPDVRSMSAGFVAAPFENALAYSGTLQTNVLELIAVATATGEDIQVWLKAGTVVDSVDLVLTYDTAKATYASSTANSALSGWTWLPNLESTGRLLIGGYSLTAINSSSDTLLETISFTQTTPGTAFDSQLVTGTGLGNGDTVVTVGTLPLISDGLNAAPVLSVDSATVSIAENAAAGSITGAHASATDADGDTVTFSLVDAPTANGSALFSIDSVSGQISLTTAGASAIDYDSGTHSYTLTVQASDGITGNEQTATVTVNLTNINDNAPVISTTTLSFPENTPAGEISGVLAVATDADGDTLTYTLVSGPTGPNQLPIFTINSATGQLSLTAEGAAAIDFENPQANSGTITVKVSDGNVAHDHTADITVNVTNSNDIAPVFTSGAAGAVDENAAVTTVIYTAATTDADNLAASTYSLSGTDAALLNIDVTTGAVTLKASANFEVKPTYSFNVIANDGANTTTQEVVVSVANINDAPTGTLTITGTVAEGQTLTVDNKLADEDGLGTFSYQWKAAGVDIAGATGDSLVLGAEQTNKAISVTATYTDGSGNPESVSASTGFTVTTETNGDITTTIPFNTSAPLNVTETISVDLPGSLSLVLTESTGSANLTDQLAASTPGGDALVTQGIADYVASVGDSTVTVRNISFPTLPVGTAAPDEAVIITGGTAQEALVIDVSNLPAGTVLQLQNVDFAVIIGASWVTGGDGQNYVVADGSAQHIVLGAEDDTIHGGAGDDYIGSLGGNDQLFGDAGNDTVSGGADNDTLSGGLGDDTLDGGDGTDSVTYAGSLAAVTVNLATGTATGEGTDTLTAIENIIGSDFADSLTGSDGDNIFTGGKGNDTIAGALGNDTVIFSGNFADYTISFDSGTNQYTIADTSAGRDGTDVVGGVDHFQFADATKTDILAPTITTFSPTDGATAVVATDNIVITFSEAIAKGTTGSIIIRSVSETGTAFETYDVLTSQNLTISESVLTINPTASLAGNTHYFVTIDAGAIKDAAGNSYAGTTAYDFTTANPYSGGGGLSTGEVLVGIGAIGILAWVIL